MLSGLTDVPGSEVQWFPLIAAMGGALALFLYGLERMTRALKAVAGSRLRGVLEMLTTNRLSGVAAGAFMTALLQSSSVTTVLLVSFISSGLMSMSQSVGVIMGANVGSTVTAQIIAFKVTELSFALIGVGFGLTLIPKPSYLRHHGEGILGLGLIFLGMTIMSDAMAPLRDYPPFVDWMIRMESPALGIAAAALFTGLVQSSAATTGIVIAMASQGLLSLSAGVALILGANIGTCVTAVLAAIGKPREAVRAALVHVLFNVMGVLIWLPFLGILADMAVWLSPSDPALAGSARMAAETPRQIANAHTLFNVTNVVLFLPFSTLLARLVERLVRDRPEAQEELIRALYLDTALLPTPSLALDQARREVGRLLEKVKEIFRAALPVVMDGSPDKMEAVRAQDDAIDALHRHIVGYLGRINESALSDEETAELLRLAAATNAIENVGDVIETDLIGRGFTRERGQLKISDETRAVIRGFHEEVGRALDGAHLAVAKRDSVSARRVIAQKPHIQQLADEAARHQIRRLVAHRGAGLPEYAVETDIVEDLRRIYYFAKRIAHGVVDDEPDRPDD